MAARLEALSQAGGVCLSKSIHDFVQQKVDLTFEDLGKRKIKETEVFAYDVLVEGLEKREKKNDKEGKKNQVWVNACSKSFLISSMCSRPTDRRTRSGVNPPFFCCSSDN